MFVGVHELLPVLDPVQMVTLRFLGVVAIFAALLAIHPPWRPKLTRREWGIVVLAGRARRPGLPARDRRGPALPLAADRLADRDLLAGDRRRARRPHASTSRAGRSPASRSRSTGVAVIVILGAGSGAELAASDPLKASVALLTPTAWALYTLISKPLAARHGSVGPVAVAMIVGSVTLIPLLPHAVRSRVGDLPATSGPGSPTSSSAARCCPYIFWAYGLRGLPVNRTAAFMYVIPCFAMGWTALFLGDAPSADRDRRRRGGARRRRAHAVSAARSARRPG